MATVQKSGQKLTKSPADVAQVTILVDRSGSMDPLTPDVRMAIDRTMREFLKRDGMVLAIRQFNSKLETIADFGQADHNTAVHYTPCGDTALFSAILDSIEMSRKDAALTPELKTHHVLVIITDGEDTMSTSEQMAACTAAIKEIDVEATFIVLDFSWNGNAGMPVGLQGIRFSNDPATFRKAIDKVCKAIGQIADNVVKQLPPDQNLCLPPAR